jgi:hypothetical protein
MSKYPLALIFGVEGIRGVASTGVVVAKNMMDKERTAAKVVENDGTAKDIQN